MHSEINVVDVAETGGDVVRCWPAGPVRGPSVPFCGRYDAIDKSPPTFTHIARATDNFCEIELRASARNR